ncbi:hypothetical protein DEU56DRAFT_761603 [Suillus clintonianus]|uniref:uncharacterized protein n=1 Tax=Suillus clintonianus TaxID=1904413 RepID=UPI001B86DDC9|nr:uncharacterized protein DEU56DRAFT_761603 [Suillus clintonianus]KAG2116143.1 hypothetical protein DEU56DRAFT_761603 [Suillus clintonianus]
MALDSAWNELEETLNTWNTFCWKKRHEDKENGATGKAVLQELVSDENRAEYRDLTKDKKEQLLQEYSEHKETKTTGICISTKLKVNDVTQTLKAVENEASAETIFYATCGSTDLPLHGVAFATEGVDEFMGSMMNIDNQDLALQEAINNSPQMFGAQSTMRSTGHSIKVITQDLSAWMHWANYWRSVVQRYLVVIEGWPDNIPFVNLSNVSSALPDLEMLLDKWEAGEICWRHLEEDEYKNFVKNIVRRKAYKSNATVVSDDKLDSPREDTPPVNTTPSGHTTTLKLTSSTPSTIPNPPSTSPTIPNLLSPELTSTAGGLGQFINNDAVSMSSILPAGSIGAGPSMSSGSSEFNFDEALANLDQNYESALDLMNF